MELAAPLMIQPHDAEPTDFQKAGEARRRRGHQLIPVALHENLIIGDQPATQQLPASAAPGLIDQAQGEVGLS